MVACWYGTRAWHQQQFNPENIVGPKGPVGKPNTRHSPMATLTRGRAARFLIWMRLLFAGVSHSWLGVAQVLSPMAFGTLEFSDGPVYSRENGSERSFIPRPWACFVLLLHLFIYVSVCVCIGGRGLMDYECDHTLPWYMCGGQRSWFFPSTMYVPWNQTRVVRLGSKHLYLLLSYLTSPQCALRHRYPCQVLPGTPRLDNIP